MTTIQRTIDSEPDDWQRNIQELVVRSIVHRIRLEKCHFFHSNWLVIVNTLIYMHKVFSRHWQTMRNRWLFDEFQKKLNCMPKQSKPFLSCCIQLSKYPYFLVSSFRGHNVTDITLTFDGTTAYPKAYQPLCTMLSKKVLNPADITTVGDLDDFIYLKNTISPNSSIKSTNPTMRHRLILFESRPS